MLPYSGRLYKNSDILLNEDVGPYLAELDSGDAKDTFTNGALFEVSFEGMDENEGVLGGSGQEIYAHSGQLAAAIKTYEKIVKLTTEFVANREKQARAKD